ncbi:MAG: protoheme IX farnesyltransferase [Rhodospirillales bacterium]|nr:heme o synthase [Rhodospirillales bacterium]MYE20122.1 protoheme IX farnesyltransferase [Rhodospirillales bacterium]
MAADIRQLCGVFKLRIGFAIALSALAGLAVAPGPPFPFWNAAALVLAVLLGAASAGAFNQFAERDLDARMIRTRDRPFVTGRFTAGPAWLTIIGALLVVSVTLAAWAANVVAATHVFLGAFVYGVVYTVWLKRRTWLNIVIGGLSGSFAVLAGAAAVDPAPSAVPVCLAVVLFLWTPPHFWSLAMAARDDYARANVPMLPVVVGDAKAAKVILAHTVALVAASLLPFVFGLGLVYLALAVIGGWVFLEKSIALVRAPGPAAAQANFKASLLQLSLILAGAMADAWLPL